MRAGWGGLIMVLAGCASTTPQFDAQFSNTTRALFSHQVLDAEAPERNRDRVVEGLEGRAAREALERYYQSFEKPPPQRGVFTIGVSGEGEK